MIRRLRGVRSVALASLGFGLTMALAVAVPLINRTEAQSPNPRPSSTVVAPQATMTAQERAERFQAGQPWDGIGPLGSLMQEDLETFTDLPVFWLGDQFGGYNLQWIGRVKYDPPTNAPNARSWDAVTLVYGTCTPAKGYERCPVPAGLHIHPVCSIRPEVVAAAVKDGPLQTLGGGALLQRFRDGHVMLWTGDVVIDMNVLGNPDLIDEAVSALAPVGVSSNRGLSPSMAPDFTQCQPIDMQRDQIITEP